jgi:hypothetical protein
MQINRYGSTFFCVLVHIWIIRTICHGAYSNDLLTQSCNEVQYLLEHCLQCIQVLSLNFYCISQIHSEEVTKPTKPLFDIFGRLPSFF